MGVERTTNTVQDELGSISMSIVQGEVEWCDASGVCLLCQCIRIFLRQCL